MSKKRERIVIIHDILKAIQDKGGTAKPTHVLYKSNLSSQMLKEYMQEMIEKGFVTESEGKSKAYSLTDRGYRYLADFTMIRNFMESYDLDE
jgi:predicted transcriptional regulator